MMRFWMATAVIFMLAGCAGVEPHPPFHRPAARDYDPVLLRHTRSGRIYNGVERILIVTATVQTPEFLQARFLEDSRVHGRTAAWAAAAADEYLVENPQLTVVVFFDATIPAWEDLHKRDTIWRVALEIANARHDPIEVKKLRESNADLRHLFPFTNPYGTLFRLTYPVPPDSVSGGDVKLSIDGPPAHIVLDFAAQ